jgi:hypothetical protein
VAGTNHFTTKQGCGLGDVARIHPTTVKVSDIVTTGWPDTITLVLDVIAVTVPI